VSLWVIVPVILLAWLGVGIVVAVLIGPALAGNSRLPVRDDSSGEEDKPQSVLGGDSHGEVR
jgi:hypothetical protein